MQGTEESWDHSLARPDPKTTGRKNSDADGLVSCSPYLSCMGDAGQSRVYVKLTMFMLMLHKDSAAKQ